MHRIIAWIRGWIATLILRRDKELMDTIRRVEAGEEELFTDDDIDWEG